MNGDEKLTSWSRCANEFANTLITINDEREFVKSMTRPVQVKKLNMKSRLSSCRGLVATDIALANIEEIEKNQLITEWIENGICTPPNSEQNTSCASSPSFLYSGKISEKSPVIKYGRKSVNRAKKCDRSSGFIDLTKSPIIGKRRRSSIEKKSRADSSDKPSFDETLSSTNSMKSPILGVAHYSCRKQLKIKRKKLQYQLDLDNDSSGDLYLKKNENRRSHDEEKGFTRAEESLKAPETGVTKKMTKKYDDIETSQDIFDTEIITASPLCNTEPYSRDAYLESLPIKKKKDEGEEELFCSYEEVKKQLKNSGKGFRNGRLKQSSDICKYSSSPAVGCGTKTVRKLNFEFAGVKELSFGDIIQDTEDYPLPEKRGRNYQDSSVSKEKDDRFAILDSEFSVEKRKFVTDTERIDCDSSTENEEDNRDLRIEKTIAGVESDSDKTVSDLIEEPMTQDYTEAAKPKGNHRPQSQLISLSPHDSTLANLQKISEISPKDSCGEQVSIVNISVENTPPRTQESLMPAPELFDSGKKKKSRPKKGSLGARLQKLISGQVSSVRLWRHQMSRESAFERSSAPCTTLLVLDTWIQYGKNLYRSKVVDDPYDLLKDCLDEANSSRLRDDNISRNLVVMINSDFVGSVKLLPGNFFKIYLPWEVFNKNSGPGNSVLHALYFSVVSNPVKTNLKSNCSESQATKNSNPHRDEEIIRKYNCPCLQNGKVHDSCLDKFTNHKIDVIAEISK